MQNCLISDHYIQTEYRLDFTDHL